MLKLFVLAAFTVLFFSDFAQAQSARPSPIAPRVSDTGHYLTDDLGCGMGATRFFWPPNAVPYEDKRNESCAHGLAGQRTHTRIGNALKIPGYFGPWSNEVQDDDPANWPDHGWDVSGCYCPLNTNWNGSNCVTPPPPTNPQPPPPTGCTQSSESGSQACTGGRTGTMTRSRTTNTGGNCGSTSDWTDWNETACTCPTGTTWDGATCVTKAPAGTCSGTVTFQWRESLQATLQNDSITCAAGQKSTTPNAGEHVGNQITVRDHIKKNYCMSDASCGSCSTTPLKCAIGYKAVTSPSVPQGWRSCVGKDTQSFPQWTNGMPQPPHQQTGTTNGTVPAMIQGSCTYKSSYPSQAAPAGYPAPGGTTFADYYDCTPTCAPVCTQGTETDTQACGTGFTGNQTRTRTTNTGGTCGSFGTWSAWNTSSCAATCTQGTETDTQACDAGFTGNKTRTRTTNTGNVCGANGTWSAWNTSSCVTTPPACTQSSSYSEVQQAIADCGAGNISSQLTNPYVIKEGGTVVSICHTNNDIAAYNCGNGVSVWHDGSYPGECSCNSNPAPVAGQCGTANGTTVSTKPASGLCAKGTASTVGGSGPWTWTCSGTNGGAPANCSAAKTSSDTCDPHPWAGSSFKYNGSCWYVAKPGDRPGEPRDRGYDAPDTRYMNCTDVCTAMGKTCDNNAQKAISSNEQSCENFMNAVHGAGYYTNYKPVDVGSWSGDTSMGCYLAKEEHDGSSDGGGTSRDFRLSDAGDEVTCSARSSLDVDSIQKSEEYFRYCACQ